MAPAHRHDALQLPLRCPGLLQPHHRLLVPAPWQQHACTYVCRHCCVGVQPQCDISTARPFAGCVLLRFSCWPMRAPLQLRRRLWVALKRLPCKLGQARLQVLSIRQVWREMRVEAAVKDGAHSWMQGWARPAAAIARMRPAVDALLGLRQGAWRVAPAASPGWGCAAQARAVCTAPSHVACLPAPSIPG